VEYQLQDEIAEKQGMMTTDEERGVYYRPGLRAFLPLNTEDGAISTRGQALPGLLQNLSSSTPRRTSSIRFLSDLGKGSPNDDTPKKGSASQKSQRRYSDSSYEDEEGLSFGRRPTLLPQDRRISEAALTLMTPQMRSQRLIGNSNPRYRWYVVGWRVRTTGHS
jgi:hypothetical protein